MHFLAFSRNSQRSLPLKAFHRKDRKDKAEAAEKGKTLIRRDQQSLEHWRDIISAAYNPAATFFFLTREPPCQSEPHFTIELFRFARA
jgi:hypothetical protein